MNPYAILAAVLIWLASLAGVGYWQNDAGHTAERLTWQQRANTELATANKEITSLEEKYRKLEQDHAVELATISDKYQKESEDAKTITDELIRRTRTGTFRLRDPGAATHATLGSIAAQTSASPCRCDAAGDRGLSADATEFLLGLTGRCNAVRNKLTACQAIVRSDRDVPPPH